MSEELTNKPRIASAEEWEAAREQLLVKEKELTRARDALAAERRRMPWLPVEKEYVFEGPDGEASLLDLFDGRRQLIAYRFFFEPGVAGWPERGCGGCSMMADQVCNLAHLGVRSRIALSTIRPIDTNSSPRVAAWALRRPPPGSCVIDPAAPRSRPSGGSSRRRTSLPWSRSATASCRGSPAGRRPRRPGPSSCRGGRAR